MQFYSCINKFTNKTVTLNYKFVQERNQGRKHFFLLQNSKVLFRYWLVTSMLYNINRRRGSHLALRKRMSSQNAEHQKPIGCISLRPCSLKTKVFAYVCSGYESSRPSSVKEESQYRPGKYPTSASQIVVDVHSRRLRS